MNWRVAKSVETLRLQLNKAFPLRSKLSDGGIGDAKHASRSSDHNPWVKDRKGVGVVTARDFTHDPQKGIDCHWLADVLVKNRDPRIKYIIWNRQICSSKTSPWKWRPYSGVNAHTKHLHLSVNSEPNHYDSTDAWKLDAFDEVDDIARVIDEPQATSVNTIAATPQAGASTSPDNFRAFIPQIDRARSWIRNAVAGTGLGSVLAVVFGAPVWVQIALFVLVLTIVIGAIVVFVKYHDKIFAYVTSMNTLRATEGVANPIVSGDTPK
jgi:hypothetical protein